MVNSHRSSQTLVFDLGGTKLLAALVLDGVVIDEIVDSTPTKVYLGGAFEEIIERMKEIASKWSDCFDRVAVAVTGAVHEGVWSSLNREVLDIPKKYPLEKVLSEMIQSSVFIVNDAQAAAWGEYLLEIGRSENLVFLTISTGVGGGIICNGDLLRGCNGLAGHFGQIANDPFRWETSLESRLAGRWFAKAAAESGHFVEARGVFEAAEKKEMWAEEIIDLSSREAALLCLNIQSMIDPNVIIIGGGIGLALGYIDRMIQYLDQVEKFRRPRIKAASLGRYAGILGAAALATKKSS